MNDCDYDYNFVNNFSDEEPDALALNTWTEEEIREEILFAEANNSED